MENAQSPSGMCLEFWNKNPNHLTYNQVCSRALVNTTVLLWTGAFLVSWATVDREVEVVFSPWPFPSSCPSQYLAFTVLCPGVILIFQDEESKAWVSRSTGQQWAFPMLTIQLWVWFAHMQTGWWDQKTCLLFLAVLICALTAHLSLLSDLNNKRNSEALRQWCPGLLCEMDLEQHQREQKNGTEQSE